MRASSTNPCGDSTMNTYLVYNGEYPFDQVLGTVVADTPEAALQKALEQYGNHCIVGPDEGRSPDHP